MFRLYLFKDGCYQYLSIMLAASRLPGGNLIAYQWLPPLRGGTTWALRAPKVRGDDSLDGSVVRSRQRPPRRHGGKDVSPLPPFGQGRIHPPASPARGRQPAWPTSSSSQLPGGASTPSPTRSLALRRPRRGWIHLPPGRAAARTRPPRATGRRAGPHSTTAGLGNHRLTALTPRGRFTLPGLTLCSLTSLSANFGALTTRPTALALRHRSVSPAHDVQQWDPGRQEGCDDSTPLH